MMNENSKALDVAAALVEQGGSAKDSACAQGWFHVECRDANGVLKWVADAPNLTTNVGRQDMNNKYFTGSSYTATWYVGLYGAAASNTPAYTDTAALHGGWTEVTPYSNATRPTATFGAATSANPSVISNSASQAVFNINATSTVGGAFLISNNTKGGTTGILFSAASFAAPGDRSVASGDTLNVTYTLNLAG